MTCDKTKQLLSILQWQALVVSVQDNDKMGVIVQCRGSFINLDALATIMLKYLIFV